MNKALYLGYGSENSAKQIGSIINSVGGSGYKPPTPDPTPQISKMSLQRKLPFNLGLSSLLDETAFQPLATKKANATRRNNIVDIVVDNDGTIYASDVVNNQIYRCTLPDHWELLAGTGPAGYSGDDGPAIGASLNKPAFIDLAPDGSLLLADFDNNRVRKIDRNGIISTLAGNGEATFSGDGGLAISAGIINPIAVSAAPDGSVYISEIAGCRIRRVGPDGIISTVAGNGMEAHTGDGGTAREASVYHPAGIDVAPDGSIYFTETSMGYAYCGCVRRIRPDGIIETVAGEFGTAYNSMEPIGDGGPAVNATVMFPVDLKVLDDGSFLFDDLILGRVRQVEADGTIHTVAGKLSFGEWSNYNTDAGDGGPATAGSILLPYGIDVSPDSTLYVAQPEYGDNLRSIKLVDFPAMDGAYHVPSPDGGEIYSFNGQGRHLSTYDAISGIKKYEFIYNEQGLFQIIDRDGKITELQRGTNNITIDGYKQETDLELDSEGYISSIQDPMGYTTSFNYDNGLMTSFYDKNEHRYSYKYNQQGRLEKSQQPDGAFIFLNGRSESRMYEVVTKTAMWKNSTSRSEEMADGDKYRQSYPAQERPIESERRPRETLLKSLKTVPSLRLMRDLIPAGGWLLPESKNHQ